jgi:acyl-CoA synthetase (AMP-forming)/AMP-acid ligase II
MNAQRQSEELHERARAMVRAFERRQPMPEAFDALAVDLARFQQAQVEGYARLCAARGVDPRAIARAEQAPAVPTDAFRLARVFAFGEGDASVVFRTSGTTVPPRGVHAIRDLRTYDAAALAFGRRMLACDAEDRIPVLVLGPDDREAIDSSLAHMCALFVRGFGAVESAHRTFFLRGGALRVDDFRCRASDLPRTKPAIVLSTSFALVHLLDALRGEVLALPEGSRVMQTGGFKGRSREVAADDLRRAVAAAFGVDLRSVVSEYGMTELSSQLWEATLVDLRAPHGVYVEPPWMRVVPVEPETLAPLPDGEVGVARIEDLANVDSAFAILALDRVRRVPGGIQLLGRVPGAIPRGCSIALDEMLAPRGLGR